MEKAYVAINYHDFNNAYKKAITKPKFFYNPDKTCYESYVTVKNVINAFEEFIKKYNQIIKENKKHDTK